jgi:hypothetical protein
MANPQSRLSVDAARFLQLLARSERGELDLVPAVRQLVAESDSVCALMEGDEELAERFDILVAAWKDLR